MNNAIILDIETESKKHNNRIACACCNQIIAYSIKDDKEQITNYIYNDSDLDALIQILIQYDAIIAHNAKFEMLYLWKYSEIQDWLKKGGRIYCTQLAEYYLTDFQTKWGALRDIAVNKYKCPERTKWIDDLLFKNKNSEYKCTSELPVNKVLEDVDNDVKDTYQVYIMQQKEIKSRGKKFENMIEIQNEVLLSTIEMEYNGMAIDINILNRNQTELQAELNVAEQELKAIIDKYWVAVESNE